MAIFIPLVTKFDAKGLEGAQRALASFQNFAVDVGRVAAAAITAVAVTSVRDAAKFETTLAQIQGLVGLTAEETKLLEEQARKLGPAFGRSAQESAEALYFITSSGIAAADAGGVLEASLKGAAVGLGEVTTIADLTTSAMNAYRTSGLTATNAVEILAEAVREGKAEPAEMAMALCQLLPIAAEMGVPFQDAAAGVAALSTTGLDANEAVTQLRGIMTSILNPTAEAAAELAKYGLNAQDLRDQVREGGLLHVLQMLSTTFEGNDEAIGKVFGNVRALTGVLALTGENAAQVDSIFANLNDGVGVLDEALAITADTAQFKFNVAMATAKDSLLEIGGSILESLIPHLDSFQAWMETNGPAIEQGFINIFNAINQIITSEVMANIIQRFAELWPEVQEAVTQFGELVALLTPVLFDSLEQVIPLFTDLTSIMNDLGFFTGEVLGLFGDWGDETPNIVEWLNTQINPFERLKEAVRQVADALNAAREAYDRFQAAGGFNQLKGVVSPNTFGGRRAGGGPVSSGSSYLVGEMGPEIFTPAAGGGRITPNNQLGGSTINITVNAGMGANGAALGEAIVSAIKRYERTSGPVFASA